MLTDKIRYHVTRQATRYGVHVTNLTKAEATAMLSGAAVIQQERDGSLTNLERSYIVDSVENPESLDPNPAGERWVARGVVVIVCFTIIMVFCHDVINNVIGLLK